MPEVDVNDLIHIDDAVKQYAKSRSYLDEQIRLGKLSVVDRPGERKKVWLLKSELDELLKPRIVKQRTDEVAS